MDLALPNVLGQPTVAFHLLPLAGAAAKAAPTKQKPSGTKKRSRSPARQSKAGTKRRSQRQEREATRTKHPSRIDQQSFGNASETEDLLGLQPPQWLQGSQAWGKLFQRPTRLCRTGVL